MDGVKDVLLMVTAILATLSANLQFIRYEFASVITVIAPFSLQQLSLLPLMEPIIGVSFAHFLPYGSGHLNSGSRLTGSFGSATLDGVSDYYSQLIYKVYFFPT